MFMRILNVVYCSQPLLLLALFKHCPRPKTSNIGCYQPKFCTRRLRRAQNHIETAFSPYTENDQYFEEMMSVHTSPKTSHFQSHVGPKAAKLGSSGLCQAQAALLFNQNPNVKLIVVQSSYCCSVVSVNTSNTVQPLTFGCST